MNAQDLLLEYHALTFLAYKTGDNELADAYLEGSRRLEEQIDEIQMANSQTRRGGAFNRLFRDFSLLFRNGR